VTTPSWLTIWSEVAKRNDVFAAAIYAGLAVAALVAMDLRYTPPFGAP
jgi:hypothetical protein